MARLKGRGIVHSSAKAPWLVRIGALIALAAALSGCASDSSYPTLPDLARIPQKLLTPQEQKQAIRELSEQKDTERAAAIKKIETTK